MLKSVLLIPVMITIIAVSAGCGAAQRKARNMAKQDYDQLSGEWRLTKAVVDGRAVSEQEVKNTILITDGNTFRFPDASGLGTHPAGTFTVNPSTDPKQVDSVAEGGPNAGQVTLGIYEIIDANHKRACWGLPGGPRPNESQSLPGSGRTLQYWEKIGPVPKAR